MQFPWIILQDNDQNNLYPFQYTLVCGVFIGELVNLLLLFEAVVDFSGGDFLTLSSLFSLYTASSIMLSDSLQQNLNNNKVPILYSLLSSCKLDKEIYACHNVIHKTYFKIPAFHIYTIHMNMVHILAYIGKGLALIA